jgi:Tat protein secretion system quality control protein TatD with DNase activity
MEKISLIDVHAHLDEVEDLPESLREAKESGVRGIIAVGVDIDSNNKILRIASENRGYVYPAIGYHPWLSATPALVYSPPHQEAIRHAPLERILLETDSPVTYQGKEARPKDVRVTWEEVARLKGIDPLIVASQTTSNASMFFQIPFDNKE